MNLVEFQQQFNSEVVCLEYLEARRWVNGRVCPHCKSAKTYKFSDGKLFKCGTCRKQFTAKIGTIFSDSKIPLYKWFLAIYLATSLKKGISSMQLSRYIGVTQKSSWFMLQRIRYALEHSGNGSMLEGVVEVDETYIGGKGENRKFEKYREKPKQVVMGMVERGRNVRIEHVKSSGARVLLSQIQEHINPTAQIYTDSYNSYRQLKKLGYKHNTIDHTREMYVKGKIHTQSIENVWSHLKRGIYGVYHQVSPKHLQKYCSEFEYRYNTRTLTDFERFITWFDYSVCRLTYKELTKSI